MHNEFTNVLASLLHTIIPQRYLSSHPTPLKSTLRNGFLTLPTCNLLHAHVHVQRLTASMLTSCSLQRAHVLVETCKSLRALTSSIAKDYDFIDYARSITPCLTESQTEDHKRSDGHHKIGRRGVMLPRIPLCRSTDATCEPATNLSTNANIVTCSRL